MNPFGYNNPVIVFLTKMADMIILSLLWFVCSIPLITLVPSCAALYAGVTDVVFGNEKGLGAVSYFFSAFRQNFRRGILLSLMCVAVLFFFVVGINAGLQIWDRSGFGAAYMALGILVVIVFGTAILFIPPTFARFDGHVSVIVRLSLYFSSRRVIRSLWYALLLAGIILSVSAFPLVIIIAPALYTDLIRRGMEKTMNAYKSAYIPEEENSAEAVESDAATESMAEFHSALSATGDKDA